MKQTVIDNRSSIRPTTSPRGTSLLGEKGIGDESAETRGNDESKMNRESPRGKGR
jgi:hypothetical protein